MKGYSVCVCHTLVITGTVRHNSNYCFKCAVTFILHRIPSNTWNNSNCSTTQTGVSILHTHISRVIYDTKKQTMFAFLFFSPDDSRNTEQFKIKRYDKSYNKTTSWERQKIKKVTVFSSSRLGKFLSFIECVDRWKNICLE